MASGRTRCTRKLRNWVVEQVESGQFPGVCWEDAAKTMFRIPWKHAGKQDFREDQDAAFFKAWAIYKGKYREGSSEGPAIWKTRLRCALNKSCEFEEVPEIGHRDGAEPYKVYRLLPPGTVPAQSGTQKLPSKRPHSSASSEKKEEEIPTKNCRLSPSLLQEPPQNEMVETNGRAGRVDFGSSGSSGSSSSSSSSSPEPQEGRDTAEALFQGELLSLELLPPPDSDYSLLLTFIYNGRVVGEAQVQSLDCRLLAEPSSSQCSMEQVIFPKPGPREPAQRLLSQLQRGVLLASNSRGLFVQRLCPIPISWNAPQMPPGPGPHLLPSNECVELFRTSYFCRDLARYFQGLGPPPKFQVTLNFWEEDPDPSHTSQSLIAVQMEQAFARRMLKETPEEQAATLSLLQSLQDPLPPLLSIPPVFFETASASLLSTCLPQ
ncbi:interferon regulatory factor 9 [Cervus elaphus]|uniref:interferon regulatory factor 9 n=1 Tax=Cervus elaphus TaxID=9860 RepID=UPI001CC323BA|nr:interferon regulatory factor 9 [Cervus elaphus]XP_043775948.1 interferon regulatory factor 9 [Cervus elaphus]XP_043775949.1 interferon regulatory factor 9 [Cervus elaphus]